MSGRKQTPLTTPAAKGAAKSRSSSSKKRSASKTPESEQENIQNSATKTTGLDDVVEVPTPAKDVIELAMEAATMEDIAFIDEDAGEEQLKISSRGKEKKLTTKIKTIANHPVIDIHRGYLAKFCNNNGIVSANGKSLRMAPKHEMCTRIIIHKEDPNAAATARTKTKKDDDEPPVNRIRLINVLFSDEIKPHLSERAAALSKDQMTMGFKNGQVFWEKVLVEYNSGRHCRQLKYQ